MASAGDASVPRPQPPSRCPICQGEIERGSVSVHGTLIGFLFYGFSWQHCWFKRPGGKKEIVIGSGQQTRGFRCLACGFVGVFKAR